MYICTDKDGHIQGYSDTKCGTKADKDGKGAYTCDYHKYKQKECWEYAFRISQHSF